MSAGNEAVRYERPTLSLERIIEAAIELADVDELGLAQYVAVECHGGEPESLG